MNRAIDYLQNLKYEDLYLLNPDGWRFSAIIVVTYVLGVVNGLPRLFRDRKALDLKFVNIIWNFGLFAYR